MKIKYKHTNIIAHDWQMLVAFYEQVFGCVGVPPERYFSGEWLEKGTGVRGAKFSGIHLRLPGWGKVGPTLEIYQYAENMPRLSPAANREGFGHIAFEVKDIAAITEDVIQHGGSKIGEIVTAEVNGVGELTFVYLADPEGNIIELQTWH